MDIHATTSARPGRLARLTALCRPPAGPWPPADGPSGDEVRLPAAYSALANAYGPGQFDEFLSLYTPHCTNPSFDLWRNSEKSAEILAHKEISAFRAELALFGVRPEQLIQWGGTDNADSLFWIPAGEPDRWSTLIVEAGQLSHMVVPGTVPDLLLGLLTGTLECPVLPEDFPSPSPEFLGLAELMV